MKKWLKVKNVKYDMEKCSAIVVNKGVLKLCNFSGTSFLAVFKVKKAGEQSDDENLTKEEFENLSIVLANWGNDECVIP